MTGIAVVQRGIIAAAGDLIVGVGSDGVERYGYSETNGYGKLSKQFIQGASRILELSADSTLAPLDSGVILQITGGFSQNALSELAVWRGDGNILTFAGADADFFSSNGFQTLWLWNQVAVLWSGADLNQPRRARITF